MELDRYVFSTVKVVPFPATGEFVNVAAIAGSDETGEWTLRSLEDERRARQFCGADAIAAAHDTLARIGFIIDLSAWLAEGDDDALLEAEDLRAALEVSESWLRQLHENNHRIVQFSLPTPVLATSAEEALDTVFERVTMMPARRATRLTKWRIISALGREYLYAGLEPTDFHRSVTLYARGPRPFTYSVDFAVTNGVTVQLAQSWSFRVANTAAISRDVKAWGWTLRELRDHGGTVVLPDRTIDVPQEVDLQVVLAPPAADGNKEAAYEEALGVFSELDATVHDHGEEAQVAQAAIELLPGLKDDRLL